MIIDSSIYSGKCVCGREHSMVTRALIVENGCLKDFEKYMSEYGITGKRCTIYGENSYKATADRHPHAEQEIVLDPNGLHATEVSTADVLARLEPDVEVLIAVGSGTIHDITRFCAYKRGIRFVSCPTGASVDGFCSTVAAMTWYGYKNTMTAIAPEIVVADIDVVSKAPMELVRSGVGDIMAKYTALTDWRIASLLTGEHLCPVIYDITKKAADTVMESVPGIIAGDSEAYTNVTYALCMSGVAMQMMGNSRPASGCEHHISHTIECVPQKLTVRFPAMHGEKAGIGTLLGVREYHKLAEIEDITPYLTEYIPVTEDELRDFFGGRLADAVIEENKNDVLAAVTPERLAECWSGIREIIAELPSYEYFYGLLEQLGAKRTLEEIGVDSADLPTLLDKSPLIRNRLTLMRIRRMIRH